LRPTQSCIQVKRHARALLRVPRNARVGIQVDATMGAESVNAIWRSTQQNVLSLARQMLACCSLVRRHKAGETGLQR